MTTTNGDSTTSASEPKDRAQLEDEIHDTREQLGETVEALTRRLDVKSRMKSKARAGQDNFKIKARAGQDKVRQNARVGQDKVRQNPSIAMTVVLVTVGLVAGAVIWRRRT